MFNEILTNTYYGNTVQQWLISFGVILGVIILGKMFYWAIGKFIKKLASKTKSKIDDIIVDEVEEPVVFALTLGGIWYAINLLSLTDNTRTLIGDGFQFLIVINVSWLIVRLFEAFYVEYLLPLAQTTEGDLDDNIFPIVRKGVKAIIWSLGIVVGLNNAGYDVGSVLAGLGIGGLALAMAAKDTVQNIFGGFTIFSDKLFKVKDRIKAAGFDGIVEEIGLRATKMRTLNGRIVTIPNSEFISNPVENISSEPSRKVSVNLGISYDSSNQKIQKAMDIINDILEKNENVLKKKFVNFSGFGDFSLNLSVIYYIKKGANIGGTNTEINLEIFKKFNSAKIDMPFPTQTILTKKA